MKRLVPLLESLLYVVAIVCLLLACTSCATSADVPGVLSQPVDSTVQRQVAAARHLALRTGRVKFNGPVTIQMGGAGNQANSTDASKAKAPVAAAPHATATETKTSRGTPWYVFAGLAALGLAGGFVLRGKLKLLWPF